MRCTDKWKSKEQYEKCNLKYMFYKNKKLGSGKSERKD